MTLQGKVFISTIDANKSDKIKNMLTPFGAIVIDFPMIEVLTSVITPEIRNILNSLDAFDWIIFTSTNGVRHFYKLYIEQMHKTEIPVSIKLAVIGTATAKELEMYFRKPDFVSSGNTSDDLVKEFCLKENIHNKNILLPSGNLAPDALQDKLREIASATRINVYVTKKPMSINTEPLEKIKKNQYDLVLFTSSSGVQNFVDIIGADNITTPIRAASIGIITAKTMRRYGINCILTASKSTFEGLVNDIVEYYTQNKN